MNISLLSVVIYVAKEMLPLVLAPIESTSSPEPIIVV